MAPKDSSEKAPGIPILASLTRPFQEFFRLQASGGILLMLCAVVAMIWANSPWAESYEHLWHTHVVVKVAKWKLDYSLHHWINDGLMVIFFFVVGLEIKREALVGELKSIRQAMLPIAAALGGMVVPAAVYAALNFNGEGAHGWGIPMATDIAFALGVLALLGKRVPLAVKVFLTALAIVDDLGAVLVIAIFYTSEISWAALGIGGAILAVLAMGNAAGIRKPLFYAILGVGVWLAFLKSGVHATIAGVLLAMTIPSRVKIPARLFTEKTRGVIDEFEALCDRHTAENLSSEQLHAIEHLEHLCERAQSPMQRLEHILHPWVTFAIMPVFALANAGVHLGGDSELPLFNNVTIGVFLGLVLGKQVGIALFSWICVRIGWASLPANTTWRHIYGAAILGGIGFTMSLFVATLAFPGEEGLLTASKVGILSGSVVSALAGMALLLTSPKAEEARAQES